MLESQLFLIVELDQNSFGWAKNPIVYASSQEVSARARAFVLKGNSDISTL